MAFGFVVKKFTLFMNKSGLFWKNQQLKICYLLIPDIH